MIMKKDDLDIQRLLETWRVSKSKADSYGYFGDALPRCIEREEVKRKSRFMHFRCHTSGAITACFSDIEPEAGIFIKLYGLSLCAPSDQFNKKKGANMSLARVIKLLRDPKHSAGLLAGVAANWDHSKGFHAGATSFLREHLEAYRYTTFYPKWLSVLSLYRLNLAAHC